MNIRLYIHADYPAVRQILEKVGLYDSDWDAEDNVNGMVDLHDDAVIVAVEDDKIIGSVYLVHFGTRVCNLFRLAVDPQYQGRGVGTALLQYVEQMMKEKGVTGIGFFVDTENPELQAFYEKRHFHKSSHAWNYFWKGI